MPPLISDPSPGLPPLPELFSRSQAQPRLQYQGAEALVYRTTFPLASTTGLESGYSANHGSYSTTALQTHAAFLKHRPRKPYRHPILDAKLTRHRILSEARVLSKLRRENVSVPALYALDWEAGWMMGEWVEGPGTVRAILEEALPEWMAAQEPSQEAVGVGDQEKQEQGQSLGKQLADLMVQIGQNVGSMHEAGVVHGDLTTSNLMLRSAKAELRSAATNGDIDAENRRQTMKLRDDLNGEVVIIDFGLAAVSNQDEDRAVDLYVLERAFGSAHPQTESLFEDLLKAYEQTYKGAKIVTKRLKEVRLRGRKKIMIG